MAVKNTKPWLEGVRGDQVPKIIECDADIIVVEAGPGTGKTHGLVRRVIRILHPLGLNVTGENVLVVAFNRTIAKQLRKTIDKCLEEFLLEDDLVIHTVHALCLEIMGSELRMLLPHEEEAMIYDVRCEFEQLRDKYKDRRHTQQALHDHLAELENHIQLWQAIESWLVRHRAQLIGDLPSLLRDRLHGGDFADTSYQHIIVDEFQDLTARERELLLELRGGGGQFVVLGDPRQSIYAFRGNDREGLAKIRGLATSEGVTVEKLSMTECYRCPENIVKAANQLMKLYRAEPMIPKSTAHDNGHVVYWKSEKAEAKGMARAILANIQEYPEEVHLVMVTRRQFGYWLREQMSILDSSLKIELNFSEGLLETWAVREAFLHFCLLVDADAPTWRAWLGYQNPSSGKGFKAPNRNADAYLKFLTDCEDIVTEAAVKQLAESARQPPGTGGKNLRERARRFFDLKQQLQWNGDDGLTFLGQVFDVSRWNIDQSPDPDTAKLDMTEVLSKTRNIFEELSLENPDSAAQSKLSAVADQLRHQIATRELFAPDEQPDLQIATLWGAKGATADHVYIIGVCNEAIPGRRRDDYPGTENDYLEEQRRLFYVSITRSKKTLVLSRAETIPNERAAQLGLAKSRGTKYLRILQPSRYLRNIIKYLPKAQQGEEWKGCV